LTSRPLRVLEVNNQARRWGGRGVVEVGDQWMNPERDEEEEMK
jgi:hypothetical protein